MTTRQELIDGINMIIREGARTTASFGPDDWTYQVHDDEGSGWTVKEVYAHLAATAEVMPALVGALSQAGEKDNAAGQLDIDQFNAQGVSAKMSLSEADLMAAFKTGNEKAAEFVGGLSDEQLSQARTFGQITAPVAELLGTFYVLHGLAHVYHCTSRPLN